MIPAFPEFKRLTLEDNEEVEARTKHFPYYSDYNFSSLWCWDIHHKRELSILNDNLVVKFTDYETGDPFLSFLGLKDTAETTQELLEYSLAIGLSPVLRLMPEISVQDLHHHEAFAVTADRSNFDYIYLASRMAHLRGNQYRSKRQAAGFFVRNHPSSSFSVHKLYEPGIQGIVKDIVHSWRTRRTDVDDQSSTHESEAIENLFTLAQVRNLEVGIVSVGGVPTSFDIEEVVNQIFSIGHFWKTAERVDGEYEFLAQSIAKYLCDREVAYLNWEQDLGIEPLRISKCSYRPSDFLKKFTVTPAPTPEV